MKLGTKLALAFLLTSLTPLAFLSFLFYSIAEKYMLPEFRNQLLYTPLLTILVSTVGVVLMSIYLSRSITRPILNLTQVALKISQGDLSHRVEITATDEPGLLGLAFNQMIENLLEARAELQQKEDRFRRLAEATFEGIIIHDGQKILDANQGFALMTGYELAEIIGMSTLTAVALESRELLLKNIQAGYDKPYEILGLRKDGSTFPAEVRGKTIPYQGQTIRVAGVQDLTERKKTEEALRESQRFIQGIADASPNVLYLYDLIEQRSVYTNRQVAEVLGYTPAEVKTMGAEFLTKVMHPHDLAQFIEYNKQFTDAPEGAILDNEYRMQHANGTWRWFHSRDTIFSRTAAGQPQLILGTAEDITERKQVEEELNKYKEYLEELVEERTAELLSANQQLEQEIVQRKQVEEALRESEERFHRLVDATFEGVVIHDQGKIIDTNLSFARMLGYELAEVMGMNALDFAVPEYRDLITRHIRLGYEKPYEVMGLKKDGTTFPAEIWAKTIPYQGRTLRVAAIRDISERKQVEEQLRFQKALLECQIEASLEGILLVSKEREWIFFNRHFIEMWGFPAHVVESRSSHEGVLAAMDKLVDPQRFAAKVKYLYKHPDETNQDELVLKNGRVFSLYSAPVKSSEGVYYGRGWYYRDVTERKQAEADLQAALAKTEALYRISQTVVLAQSLPELLQVVVDSVVEAVPANRAALITLDPNRQEITDFTKSGPGSDQILAIPYDELWQGLSGWVMKKRQPALSPKAIPDERESLQVRQRRAETNCGAIMVAPLLYRDNVLGTLTAINRPEDPDFTSADVDLLLALANQAAIILEHKRAEEAVRASEAKLRTLFELLPVGVSIIDRDQKVVDLNLALESILGASRSRLLRGASQSRYYIRPDGTPLRPEEFPGSRALTKQQAIFNMEMGVVKEDGATIWTDVSAAPLPIADLGAVVVTTDITERKQAEAALRQYAAELQARNEELDSFAHTVAHDLQSPLGPIIGIAEILAEDYAAMPGEELRKYLGSISRNARKMNSIIRELLLLASVRQQEVKRQPLNMGNIVAEVQQRLMQLIEEHHAKISLPATWPVALGYAPWVEEVWANYLNNGIKYGGRPPRLELGATVLAEKNGMVRFWVRDNGPGLTPEDQARLFIPFTRLSQVKVKGHGLGLSIVRRIVEKLGGQVAVESEGLPGQGCTFSFTLPQAD